MSAMGDALDKVTEAIRDRHAHHARTVTSVTGDRPDTQPSAGQPTPAGPTYPLPAPDPGTGG